eukprot:1976339-Pyramimonas_sp.AAC.1
MESCVHRFRLAHSTGARACRKTATLSSFFLTFPHFRVWRAFDRSFPAIWRRRGMPAPFGPPWHTLTKCSVSCSCV